MQKLVCGEEREIHREGKREAGNLTPLRVDIPTLGSGKAPKGAIQHLEPKSDFSVYDYGCQIYSFVIQEMKSQGVDGLRRATQLCNPQKQGPAMGWHLT